MFKTNQALAFRVTVEAELVQMIEWLITLL